MRLTMPNHGGLTLSVFLPKKVSSDVQIERFRHDVEPSMRTQRRLISSYNNNPTTTIQ